MCVVLGGLLVWVLVLVRMGDAVVSGRDRRGCVVVLARLREWAGIGELGVMTSLYPSEVKLLITCQQVSSIVG